MIKYSLSTWLDKSELHFSFLFLVQEQKYGSCQSTSLLIKTARNQTFGSKFFIVATVIKQTASNSCAPSAGRAETSPSNSR